MSYANGTTHYNLPQTVGTDKRDWFDTNTPFENIDADLYSAKTTADNNASSITSLTTRVGDNEDEIASLKTRVGGAEGDISALQSGQTGLSNQIGDVKADLSDAICAVKEADATADYAHAVGTYFWYNDTLYETTQAIAVGDTIVPNTNCNTTNVTSEILKVTGDINQINTALINITYEDFVVTVASGSSVTEVLTVPANNLAIIPVIISSNSGWKLTVARSGVTLVVCDLNAAGVDVQVGVRVYYINQAS